LLRLEVKANGVWLQLRDLWALLWRLLTRSVDGRHKLVELICSVAINHEELVHLASADAEMLNAKLVALGGLRD
jgi:hypothetical protein